MHTCVHTQQVNSTLLPSSKWNTINNKISINTSTTTQHCNKITLVQFDSATIRLSCNFKDPQIICWNYIVLGCHHIRGLNWNVSSVWSVPGGDQVAPASNSQLVPTVFISNVAAKLLVPFICIKWGAWELFWSTCDAHTLLVLWEV